MPDGDDANGHQVALQDLGEITVTVTSARRQPESRPTAWCWFPEHRLGSGPRSLAALPARRRLRGLQPRRLRGGSVEELVGCAESRDIVALYALHEGVYVSYILGAPDFVNREFRSCSPMACRPSRRWSPRATDRPRRTRSGTSKTVGSRGRSACAAPSPPASASSSTRGATSRSWSSARRAWTSPPCTP